MTPQVSIVVPVYEEGEAVVDCLDRLAAAVSTPFEALVVYDDAGDGTVPYLRRYADGDSRVRPLLNRYGPGPANAIRFGLDAAAAPVVAVTMADGSDDVTQIDRLVDLVAGGAAIAAASRYMPGGRQLGGPLAKRLLSRLAGRSLYALASVGTRDATNSFKAYDARFVRQVGVASRHGFEVAIELVAKARRRRLPIAEIPTTWHDRTCGRSSFRLWAWIPRYLRWYLHAFGPMIATGAPAVGEPGVTR